MSIIKLNFLLVFAFALSSCTGMNDISSLSSAKEQYISLCAVKNLTDKTGLNLSGLTGAQNTPGLEKALDLCECLYPRLSKEFSQDELLKFINEENASENILKATEDFKKECVSNF